MGGNGGTPQALSLGIGLRAAREAAGLGLRQLADELGLHAGTLSRWEGGSRLPRLEDVALILGRLGVTDERRDELLELARKGDQFPWLSLGSHQQGRQLATLLEFEANAALITCVDPLLIPGLMQTSEYARAIMQGAEFPAHEAELRVAVRMGRRDILTNSGPRRLNAFIGEAALRNRVGGRDVLARQLDRLLEMADWETVTAQVVPFAAGWHPGLTGAFVLVERDEADPVVHIEIPDSGLFLHEPKDTAGYRRAIDMVSRSALSPAESVGLIADVMSELQHEGDQVDLEEEQP